MKLDLDLPLYSVTNRTIRKYLWSSHLETSSPQVAKLSECACQRSLSPNITRVPTEVVMYINFGYQKADRSY
eukprot:3921892-Amphidinium_carterae.1